MKNVSATVIGSSLIVILGLVTPLLRAGDLGATIDAIGKNAVESGMALGLSIGVARGGTILHAAGFGSADLENDVPATAQTNYRIGSITKCFTATAIMQLVESGKISLSDPITKFIPGYNTHGFTITVQELLNHTAGIPNYTEIEAKDRTKWRLQRSHEEMRAVFEGEALLFEPGMGWHYSNSGYYLLGMIIENVSGTTYEEYLKAHVIDPAGLSNTQYGHQRPLIKHRCRGYDRAKEGWVNAMPISMTTPFAAGALRSTVTDLLTWHRALIDGTLVKPETYRKMVTVIPLPKGRGSHSYGFGFYLGELDGHRTITHPGEIDGFSTWLTYYPDDDLTVVVLTNNSAARPAMIEHQVARAVFGLPQPQPKSLPLTARDIENWGGTYLLGTMGIHVTQKDGKLLLAIDGFLPPMELLNQGNGELWLRADPDTRVYFDTSTAPARKVRLMFMDMEMVAVRSR